MEPDREHSEHFEHREYYEGRVPLPGYASSGRADPGDDAAAARSGIGRGIGHARRMSNWTAAALIVGTGAATVALAHHAIPVAGPAAGGSAAGATTGTGTTGAAAAGAPQAPHSIATTSGSGVTTTTVTHVVNGKTVVTHVRHVPVHHDN
jgi:hypothetical protein